MDKKRTYFGTTTAQQRRLLFEIWEESGDRLEACRKARVSQGTFYYWKPRFEAGGYEALDEPLSHAPHHPNIVSAEIEEQVIEMRQAHPGWGKRRLSDELAKGNNWVPLVSPNTVRRILQGAELWPEAESKVKKGGRKTASAPRKVQDKR